MLDLSLPPHRLQPTLMAAVPAVLDTIHAGLVKKVADGGGVKAKLFFGAVILAAGETAVLLTPPLQPY